jgi:hypothetical protein
MPAAITTLRSTIAAALANAGIWSVYKYPPRTITANAVIIDPGDPYISPSNNRAIGISPMARFTIILTSTVGSAFGGYLVGWAGIIECLA